MTKVQAKELEDKFILAVLQLIFYATINKKCFSFAPLSEAELAVWCFGERKNNYAEKIWAKPPPNPALKGRHNFCTTLQGGADRAQDVPKKALPYTGNQMQASSDTDLESTLLFSSLVGHRIWFLQKKKKINPFANPSPPVQQLQGMGKQSQALQSQGAKRTDQEWYKTKLGRTGNVAGSSLSSGGAAEPIRSHSSAVP